MKKILITGSNSYIGTAFEKYVDKYKEYKIDTLDLQNVKWREKDFSIYDVVFHVAAVVHKKETTKNRSLFYSVNRNLAVEVAKKAKQAGVRQFIIMSSMSVYGKTIGTIYQDSVPMATSAYGKSKAEADDIILRLNSDKFTVSIIRPPMVYGKGCKGNFHALFVFIKRFCMFFNTNNRRSMIYIDNLCEFIHKVIQTEKSGIFLPQNKEYVSTDELAYYIAKTQGKRLIRIRTPKKIIKKCDANFSNKLFEDLVYEKIDYGFNYHIIDNTEETIRKSIE